MSHFDTDFYLCISYAHLCVTCKHYITWSKHASLLFYFGDPKVNVRNKHCLRFTNENSHEISLIKDNHLYMIKEWPLSPLFYCLFPLPLYSFVIFPTQDTLAGVHYLYILFWNSLLNIHLQVYISCNEHCWRSVFVASFIK